VTEHEAPYTATRDTMRFWVCWKRLDSGELVAWVAASRELGPDYGDCESMGPYDSAAEASGVCQRVKSDRVPEGDS